MTPFREFCVALFGEEFSASQVGQTLGVSRDTIRQWLKRETMPAAVSIEVLKRRMQHAIELCDGIHDRLDDEDKRAAEEEAEAALGHLRVDRMLRESNAGKLENF